MRLPRARVLEASLLTAAATLFLVSALGSGGCAEADGAVQGGKPLFDAALPDQDAAAVPLCLPRPDAGSDIDAGGHGHTFTDLYQDYFGQVGLSGGGCAGNGRCHGSSDQPGATASDFVCPSADQNGKDTCYQYLRSSRLVSASDPTAPEHARLYTVLRKTAGAGGGGTMPKVPVCAFDETDMKRIADWIRAGARSD